ncbi:hypothetical protein ES705_17499 [subsurface metagenome]
MPIKKLCPFAMHFDKDGITICVKSECELWSTQTSMCIISMGMLAILDVSVALRGISENIRSLDSFQS